MRYTVIVDATSFPVSRWRDTLATRLVLSLDPLCEADSKYSKKLRDCFKVLKGIKQTTANIHRLNKYFMKGNEFTVHCS